MFTGHRPMSRDEQLSELTSSGSGIFDYHVDRYPDSMMHISQEMESKTRRTWDETEAQPICRDVDNNSYTLSNKITTTRHISTYSTYDNKDTGFDSYYSD